VIRGEISELHNIQPIGNLASIFRHGILSHERSARIPHTSIANQEVQDRRASVDISFRDGSKRRLHSYANLYIHARNPMMFVRSRNRDHEDLCVLRVSQAVLDLHGALVTDKNAAADGVAFYLSLSGLAFLDYELVFATYWTDPDPIVYQTKRQARCAEVLIPDRVPSEYITGIYVSCERSAAVVDALRLAPVEINRQLFFQ
jgi:hypothetical protein